MDTYRFPIQIRWADIELGELKFTGTVLNDNIAGWIASLENVFGLRAVEVGDRIVLQARPE